jgi:hypothetical protein
MPKDLEDNKDVFFDLSRPTCSLEWCPWGSKRTSPVTITPKAMKRLGIARVGRIWDFQTVELIVSRDVRVLFDAAKVTGLEYEACWPTGPEQRRQGEPPAYLARVTDGTYQCAEDVDVGRNYCPEHSIAIGPYPFCLWTPRDALLAKDFQMLHTIRVRGKDYYRYMSLWIVARRILELLLSNKVPGLKQATVFLKGVFRPLLTDDKHWMRS